MYNSGNDTKGWDPLALTESAQRKSKPLIPTEIDWEGSGHVESTVQFRSCALSVPTLIQQIDYLHIMIQWFTSPLSSMERLFQIRQFEAVWAPFDNSFRSESSTNSRRSERCLRTLSDQSLAPIRGGLSAVL